MPGKSRGATLTIFAILFALLAISNFSKPFSHQANFVFLGTRLTGTFNVIMSVVFGFILLAYAYGIWAMRKFALPLAYFYAPWVVLNMVLFTMKYPSDQPMAAGIGMVIVGTGIPIASAILLSRRRADLA